MNLVRGALADLRTVGPRPPTRTAAARAAVTMTLPLLVLWATGRLDLGVYATFGAFTAVYGGASRYDTRWRAQVAGGTVQVAAVATGCVVSAASGSPWAVVAATAVWALLGAIASDRWRWVPPGPLFVVFAVGATGSVPIGWDGVPPAVLAALAPAVLAVALGALEVRRLPHTGRPQLPSPPPPHRRRLHAVRCLVVVALAGGLMTALGTEHAYWAMVSAVVPFARPGLRTQLTRGAHRILGTLAGLALAALLLALSPPALVTVLLIGVLQGLTERVVTRHYAAALVLITPLALLAIQLAHPEPVGDLLASRLLETVAGAAIGMAAAVLTRERRPGTVGA